MSNKRIDLDTIRIVEHLKKRIKSPEVVERAKKLHELNVDTSAVTRDFYCHNSYNNLMTQSVNDVIDLMKDPNVEFYNQHFPPYRSNLNHLENLRKTYVKSRKKLLEKLNDSFGFFERKDIESLIKVAYKKLDRETKKYVRKAISAQVSYHIVREIKHMKFRINFPGY